MDINARKVAGVIVECNRAINGQGFNHGEVLIGLSELIGRVIVEAGTGRPSSVEQMKEIVKSHIDETVRIGFETKGIIHTSGS